MNSSIRKNRPLFILLTLIFVVFLNVPILGIGGMTASGPEYLIWVAIFTIILLSVVRVVRDKVLVTPSCLKYFLLYAVLILSSSIFNPISNLDLFTINAMHLMAGVLIWLSLHQYRLDHMEKERLLLIMLISAAIGAAIYILEPYFFPGYLSPTGGVFVQKNLFASWTATGMVISLYLITTDWFKDQTKVKKVMFYTAVLLLSAGIILASSRAGMLGAGLAILVFFIAGRNRYTEAKKSLVVWVLILMIGMASGFYLATAKRDLAEDGLAEKVKIEAKRKAEWISDTKQRSYAERLLMYRTSYEMFKDKPLWGQGFSNFGSLYMYHQAVTASEEGKESNRLILSYTIHPHNEFFYILAECGMLGIAAIAIAFFGFFRVLYRSMGAGRAGIYISFLLPFFVHMMVEFPLKLSTAHYLMFLILLYMVTDRDTEKKELKLKKGASAAVIVIAALLYAGPAAYTFKTLNDYISYVTFLFKFDDHKIISEENARPAMDNIYLRNWAVPDYMFAKAITTGSDLSGNTGFVPEYLRWSDMEKRRRPIRDVFLKEAVLLFKLGMYDKGNAYELFNEAMKTTEEGLALYPNSTELQQHKSKILSNLMKMIYENRKHELEQ